MKDDYINVYKGRDGYSLLFRR